MKKKLVKAKILSPVEYSKDGSIVKRKRKKTKPEDLPLYHRLEIGASYNIHTGEHQPMNLYISDEMLKASERDRLRRLSEAEKIKEEVITIKPEKK